ncbi:MAG: diacylglycerol kinase family lipid kinase [Dehalococcoidia bacterium]|nr:diacylglycerol kinase family lipid kinase [Dehalococcoidia bacterium]
MQPPYRSATLLVNPAARGVARRVPEPERIVRYLRHRGLEAQLVTPGSALEATAAAEAAAARGDDLLFVAGGDGSVRDAALGLAGSDTALAALPAGTVNIWARETGVPRGIRAAVDAHLAGQTAHVDLGRADGHCFLLMASAGWDAAVARRVSPRLKRRLGDVAYMLQGAKMAPRLRPIPACWHTDGAAHEGRVGVLVVSNTRVYGGKVQFSPGAFADDGLLDVVAACPGSPWAVARLGARLARGRIAADPAATAEVAHEVTIDTPGIPYQLDGDYAGESPVTFRADPGALRVSLPAGPRPAILAPQT